MLPAPPPPDILGDINRRLTPQSQRNRVAGSGVDGSRHSFAFETDGGEIGVALHIGQDHSLNFYLEVFAETFNQVMTHGPWRNRRV